MELARSHAERAAHLKEVMEGIIGELIGRDHSTVTHYRGMVKAMILAPVMYAWEYETYLDFQAEI